MSNHNFLARILTPIVAVNGNLCTFWSEPILTRN